MKTEKRTGKKDLMEVNTTTIKLIQPAKLMKLSGRVYFTIMNKKTKKLYQWDDSVGKWRKGSLWCNDTVEPCSLLEFLTITGKTFASTVSKQFGLEVME